MYLCPCRPDDLPCALLDKRLPHSVKAVLRLVFRALLPCAVHGARTGSDHLGASPVGLPFSLSFILLERKRCRTQGPVQAASMRCLGHLPSAAPGIAAPRISALRQQHRAARRAVAVQGSSCQQEQAAPAQRWAEIAGCSRQQGLPGSWSSLRVAASQLHSSQPSSIHWLWQQGPHSPSRCRPAAVCAGSAASQWSCRPSWPWQQPTWPPRCQPRPRRARSSTST